ncbi:M23 family metallopeptidase [Emticicia agri]|uniref:M23 family metallopeptidase n=1 Tax=Emticicia agri TaxID=2492393 RepID=A0A4Q5LZ69_9BACT|nr:M23 family metallopeptidase [Emticicia agri]RYU94867.1 M23 family metallopeptidase [Emticicia agri]
MIITRVLSAILLIVYLISDTSLNLSYAQREPGQAAKEQYPKGYFMFPIQPGKQASLSGGFGDLRTNHFHAGLDIRTGAVEGYNVYAAADGYVSRIRVMRGGYGNVLYITHPNGYTTVYGHLKNYNTAIEAYLRRREYSQKVWEIELTPNPNELKVRKGEIVAISGNTGASGGPHLHFEIRDALENAINPMKFGFPEIQDSQAPVIERVILKTLNAYSRVNGEFGRVSMAPKRSASGEYILPNIVKAQGIIGLELNTYDRSQTSPFRMGITALEVEVDGKSTYKLNLEKMPFDVSKDINVHIDYDISQTDGVRIQKCYVADGNRISVYETDKNKGRILISDNQLHSVYVRVKDTYGNTSVLTFSIQGEAPILQESEGETPLAEESKFTGNIATSITENTLAIRAKNTKAPFAVVQNKGVPTKVPLSYVGNKEAVYLYDLNKGIADFAQVDNSSALIGIKKEILPQIGQFYTEPNLRIDFNNAVYDTLYLTTGMSGNRLTINTQRIPLKDNITVQWTPSGVSMSPKTGVYDVSNGRSYLGGVWVGSAIQFKTRRLGSFMLFTDNEAPSVRPARLDSSYLSFVISDNLSGIKSFNCFVDGEWVLMDYEYKNGRIWSIKIDEERMFGGDLKLEVVDNVGNVGTYQVNLDEYFKQKQVQKSKKKHAPARRKSGSGSKSKKSRRR